MCGILFRSGEGTELWETLKEVVARRGPDYTEEVAHGQLRFFSSILSLRLPFQPQPVVTGQSVLQFNGELYNSEVDGNDTVSFNQSILTNGVIPTLQWARGEYAFVYYDPDTGSIWFGRDCIGRRSLLYSLVDGVLTIASVLQDEEVQFEEVPGGVVYKFDISTRELTELRYGRDIPWPYPSITNATHGTDRTDEFERALTKAVRERLVTIPPEQDTIAVLFSGGLDCTLLASIADQVLPSHMKVDLLNVAFENPRAGNAYEDTPDRKLGRRSHLELNNPGRFRFVAVNVPYSETLQHRQTVRQLMYPKDSIMDQSIALAFYFASRGQGVDHTSTCKVLLSGLGADELFGGYLRHYKKLVREGYDELTAELQLDFDRLHVRNLGRDDRVCTIWGKEMRYPFLDENVVKLACEVPVDQKVLPNSEDQTKCLLRRIAQNRGLALVAEEKKRAIQFGARSAKMEHGDSRFKGHEKLDTS